MDSKPTSPGSRSQPRHFVRRVALPVSALTFPSSLPHLQNEKHSASLQACYTISHATYEQAGVPTGENHPVVGGQDEIMHAAGEARFSHIGVLHKDQLLVLVFGGTSSSPI